MSDTWILRVSMTTPVGDTAAQTATSVRAGINRYRASAVLNQRMQPMTMALLPEDALPPLHDDVSAGEPSDRLGRMLQLATSALAELAAGIDASDVPVFLALPEALYERSAPADAGILEWLALQAGVAFDREASEVFPLGRAGGLHALEAAQKALARGRDLAIVAGVDSHLDLELLSHLDADGRVLAEGVMDGFAPGEGAGFLLVGNSSRLDLNKNDAAIRVGPPGLASEAGHRFGDAPYRGDGLANAVSAALKAANGSPVRTVFASLNGESFGAKEWGVASMRNAAQLGEELRIEHPADCFGDLGAATAPVLLGLAALALERDNDRGPCLVWCSSELEPRGAALVTIGKP